MDNPQNKQYAQAANAVYYMGYCDGYNKGIIIGIFSGIIGCMIGIVISDNYNRPNK